VFRTHDPEGDKLVAVKAYALDLTPEQADRLSGELQRLVDLGLEHPHIASPIATGVEDFVAYLASQYVAGESLDAAVRQYGPAPVGDAARLIGHVADALDAAARVGVFHGSLHPRDILVTPGETHMTGLGVAKALEHLGLHGPIRRPYVAPERENGEEWGAAADVFSLAAIAYEVLTGRRALPGTDQPLPALSDLKVGDMGALRDVLEHGLDPDPERRPARAVDFAKNLAGVLLDGTGLERAPGTRQRRARPRPPKLPGLDEPLMPETPSAPVPQEPAMEPIAAALSAVAQTVVPAAPAAPAVPPDEPVPEAEPVRDLVYVPESAPEPEPPAPASVAVEHPAPDPEPDVRPEPEPERVMPAVEDVAAVSATPEPAAEAAVEQVSEPVVVAAPEDRLPAPTVADAVFPTALPPGVEPEAPPVAPEPEVLVAPPPARPTPRRSGRRARIELSPVVVTEPPLPPVETGAAPDLPVASTGGSDRPAAPSVPVAEPVPADAPVDREGDLLAEAEREPAAAEPEAARPLELPAQPDDLADFAMLEPVAPPISNGTPTPDFGHLEASLERDAAPRRRSGHPASDIDDLRLAAPLSSQPPVPRALDPMAASHVPAGFEPLRPVHGRRPVWQIATLGVAAGLVLGLVTGYLLWARGPSPALPAGSAATTSAAGSGVPLVTATPPAATTPASAADTSTPVPAASSTAAPSSASDPGSTPAGAAPAPARPAPAITAGRLLVRSTPANADVFVNGERRGVTPRNVGDLPFGTYTVRVTRPGYVAQQRDVTLTARAPSVREVFTLTRTGERPAAVPAPTGAAPATPKFTGTKGAAPKTAAPKATTPKTAAFKPVPKATAPKAGVATPPAAATSEPGAAPRTSTTVVATSMSLESRPAGARVRVDGRNVGVTPLTISPVEPGDHTVELQLPGFRVWTTTVTVPANRRQHITASLERDITR
jgi:eukaryotic-like serine/threonine-protein kinase